MDSDWVPPLLLAGVAVLLFLMRGMPARRRIALDAVCLAAISGWLSWHRQPPIFDASLGLTLPNQLWLQALAVSWWLLAARVTASLVRFFLGHDRRSREMRLFSDLAAAGLYLGATLVILSFVLDLPIRGLVATSGIIAIVIGLALQNTLADVFAGIAVGIEQPFRVGDRIRLADHIEGTVAQVNWRSIRIETDEDDIAVIPNSTVAKAEIVNRSSPSQRRGAKVEVTVRATIPPQQVTQLLQHAVLLCPDILEHPEPTIALTGLGDALNTYTVAFAVGDGRVSAARSLLLCQVRRMLHHAGMLAGAEEARGPAQLLRDLVLLESLDDAQIGALADQLAHRSLAAGDTLFAEGTVDATLYVVGKGILEVRRGPGVGSLGRIGPGEYIGEIGLLTGSAHTATVRALTEASVYLMSREVIAPLMANHEVAAALEASVHRGLALAQRDSAARASSEVTAAGQLLSRIRHFFKLPVHSEGEASRQLEPGDV